MRRFVSEIMAPKERSKAREFNKQATARTTSTATSGRPIPHLSCVLLSLAASIFSVGLKFAAYLLTGSMGLFSDALESIANVVGALGALFALWYAARPADRTHPYGHQKIEFFASGFEGGLILLAALFICYSSVVRLFHPVMPEALGFGMGLVVVSTTANLFVGYTLLRIGRRANSIVLEADGRHLLTDVWTTVGVLLGLAFVAWAHEARIDPMIAIVVSGNIVRVGWNLLRRSFDGLMDHALTPEENTKILAAIKGSLLPGMTYHAVRTRRAGAHRFVDYHLLVPGDLEVRRAHDFEMAIGESIRQAVQGIEVNAHIEPVEEPLSYGDHE